MAEENQKKQSIVTPPWDVGDLIRAVILSVIVVVIALLVIVALGMALRAVGLLLPSSRIMVTVALILVQNMSFMAGVWAFGLRKHRVGPGSLGLRPYTVNAGCTYSAFALMLSFGFNAFYSLVFFGSRGDSLRPTPVLPLFGGGLAGFTVALVLASLLVPVVEEIFFRGFLFPSLARRFGFVAGALISALLFGAAHLNGAAFVPLSFFGLVLALLYSATGSILPGIMMHSVNNSLALLLAFFIEMGITPP